MDLSAGDLKSMLNINGANNKLWKWSKKCRDHDRDKRPTFAELRQTLEELKMTLHQKRGGGGGGGGGEGGGSSKE